MKYVFIFILAGLLLSPEITEAQKRSRKEQRVAKKERVKKQNEMLHHKAIRALETDAWAFEADGLYDQKKMLINSVNVHSPNVIGLSGKRVMAYLTYTTVEGTYCVSKEGWVRAIKRSVTKRGKVVYRIHVKHPFPAEITVVLNKDSNLATVHLHEGSTTTKNHDYKGRIVPITESRHFFMMKVKP